MEQEQEIKQIQIIISDTTHHRNKIPKYRVITATKAWAYQGIESIKQDLTSALVQSQLKQKLSSYVQQDKLKKIYEPNCFLTFSELIRLLEDCGFTCYYCHQPVSLLYEKVCQNNQWTLDRIDNAKGHNYGNVCISCLKCNLKRRKTNAESFYFSNNIVVEKIG